LKLKDAEIIEMAKQEWSAGDVYIGPDIRSLTRFARLIEAATKEECAKGVYALAKDFDRRGLEGVTLIKDCAAAIRNSGGEI
jgi:hypothetical protein